MSKKIDLRAYTYPTRNLDYRSGDILKKVRQNQELQRVVQSYGLVTNGYLEATQIEGGYGWAISEYIEFGYKYTDRPIFTWGLDGCLGIDWSAGDNMYSRELPASISALTSETFQPAIFVPRICHWHVENHLYLGCYILVCQVNPQCTETDKTVRVHYMFTGEGS